MVSPLKFDKQQAFPYNKTTDEFSYRNTAD